MSQLSRWVLVLVLAAVCRLGGSAEAQFTSVEERQAAFDLATQHYFSYLDTGPSYQTLMTRWQGISEIPVANDDDYATLESDVRIYTASTPESLVTYYARPLTSWSTPAGPTYLGFIAAGPRLQVQAKSSFSVECADWWVLSAYYNSELKQDYQDACCDSMMAMMDFSNKDGMVQQKMSSILLNLASSQLMYQLMAQYGMTPNPEMLVPSMWEIRELEDAISAACGVRPNAVQAVDNYRDLRLSMNETFFALYQLFYEFPAN